MQRLAFEKYQGLGNDFILLRQEDPDSFDRARASRLCDRHYGVGGDGVLLVSPPRSAGAAASMTVLNADGSRPEMCGNGLRCVALHLARELGRTELEVLVDTDAGPRACQVELEPNAKTSARVKTHMGRGRLEGELEVKQVGQSHRFQRVSVGNPHAVRFGPPESLVRIDELSPLLSAEVPGGLNVEFATQTGDREIDVVVWERGVGRTLACGTGAAATAVAAATLGLSPFDVPVTVRLPGGPLEIVVARESLEVELRGPAHWVFSGEWRGP